MTTFTGSGHSTLADSRMAAAQAVHAARSGFDSYVPAFGLLFAGPDHDLDAALDGARGAANGADFIACTTAGEFTENGLHHGTMAAMVVGGDGTSHIARCATGLKDQSGEVAAALGTGFAAAKEAAFDNERLCSTTILLTDGLAGTGEEMIAVLREHVGPFQQIAGGAAGDEGRFQSTQVGGNGNSAAVDAAAALHLFSRTPWGIGVGHGLDPASERMLVTRAEGNVVHEIDGLPAFEIYRRHAATQGVRLSPDKAGGYMIANEIGIFTFDRISKARAPLAVGEDGSLTCAAPITEGASVCILDGKPHRMVEAAKEAAEEAKEHLEGADAAGVLVFDCVCRGMILEGGFQEEIDAVRSVFGEVPVTGFLTYGEIARYRGRLGGWHNTTAVVVAIPR